MATDIIQENIGGAGDNMSRLLSEKTELEPTGENCRADGAKSDAVPYAVKLVSASSAVDMVMVDATVSLCTMSGDNKTDKCTIQPVHVQMKSEGVLNLPQIVSDQDKCEPQSSSDNAAPNPREDIQASTLILRTEQAVCQEIPNPTSSASSSSEAKEGGNPCMNVTLPVPIQTKQVTNSVIREIKQEQFATGASQVAQDVAGDSLKESSESMINQDFQILMTNNPPSQLERASSSLATQASEEILHTTSLPDSSVKERVQNPNPEIQDLGMFANPISDPTVASFYQEENLKPSISEIGNQSVSSLGQFSEFSQQQPAVDSLPGITPFSKTPSSSLMHGVAGDLKNCVSSGLPSGNLVNNVVYAAVPLQQTANGMQLAPLHPNGNAYTLAHPNNPTRRVLLPRGHSASSKNTPKENSFKDTISVLTYEKPNVGLVQQIMGVFHATGRKEMQPCEVYDGLDCCYPYYQRMNPNRRKSWMSSVRHALTTPCFKSRRPEDSDGKLAPRKGSFWSINDNYDPQEKPSKRITPVKRPLNSPINHRRPLGVNTQQANWHPYPSHNHNAHQQHRSAHHSPYNYFSPTKGSFSPVGPSGIPVVYNSPTQVYQSQTPTAALLPNGKMIYLSPAQDDATCHHNQSFGRDMYQAWGANSTTTPSLWQVVQNMSNGNGKDQLSQNRNFYGNLNGGQQQQQGNGRFPADCTAVTNINCNNATMTPSLGFTSTTQQQQDQLKLQLLQQAQMQQQIQQQQLLQQQQQQAFQQQQQQQQASADSDPFTVALELSEIKGKQGSGEKDQADIKPLQEVANVNSNAQGAMTIEMTCTPEPHIMLVGESQHPQQLTAEAVTVSAQSQHGCDELRNMVYQSLGVCNDLATRPTTSSAPIPTQLNTTPATQFSTMPTTQYQLIHYSGNSQQYESMVI